MLQRLAPVELYDPRPHLSTPLELHVVETMGIEPTTSGLQSPRSTN